MAVMANPAGESSGEFPRLDFDRRLMLQRGGSVVASSASLLAHRQLDDALGLTMMAKGRCAHGPERPDALVGLGVADGNQGLAATFPSGP
jgi:hypothetical protein